MNRGKGGGRCALLFLNFASQGTFQSTTTYLHPVFGRRTFICFGFMITSKDQTQARATEIYTKKKELFTRATVACRDAAAKKPDTSPV
jgi:hypothetical protein